MADRTILTPEDRRRAREVAASMPPFTEEQAALLVRVLGPGVRRRVEERAERGAA